MGAPRACSSSTSAGSRAAVAGVPPDYFSATGQRWGNPLYDWEAVRADGYAFWIERVRGALARVDRIRLDHFRGFEAYWEIPAGDADRASAAAGCPGRARRLFEALERALGPLPFIAENLGVITPEVEALRRRFGFPGMAILQFAFGERPAGARRFRPHNYVRDTVAYTGTHDNDTVMGWWEGGAGDSVADRRRDVAREKAFARAYLGADGDEHELGLIRAVLASVADTAVVPLQDVLGLGPGARMNRPATLGGNWGWRVREAAAPAGAGAARLAALAPDRTTCAISDRLRLPQLEPVEAVGPEGEEVGRLPHPRELGVAEDLDRHVTLELREVELGRLREARDVGDAQDHVLVVAAARRRAPCGSRPAGTPSCRARTP